MGEIINLRTRRKQAARDAARDKGDQQALTHGVSRTVKQLDTARAEAERRKLDGHRREPGPEGDKTE